MSTTRPMPLSDRANQRRNELMPPTGMASALGGLAFVHAPRSVAVWGGTQSELIVQTTKFVPSMPEHGVPWSKRALPVSLLVRTSRRPCS